MIFKDLTVGKICKGSATIHAVVEYTQEMLTKDVIQLISNFSFSIMTFPVSMMHAPTQKENIFRLVSSQHTYCMLNPQNVESKIL